MATRVKKREGNEAISGKDNSNEMIEEGQTGREEGGGTAEDEEDKG